MCEIVRISSRLETTIKCILSEESPPSSPSAMTETCCLGELKGFFAVT